MCGPPHSGAAYEVPVRYQRGNLDGGGEDPGGCDIGMEGEFLGDCPP